MTPNEDSIGDPTGIVADLAGIPDKVKQEQIAALKKYGAEKIGKMRTILNNAWKQTKKGGHANKAQLEAHLKTELTGLVGTRDYQKKAKNLPQDVDRLDLGATPEELAANKMSDETKERLSKISGNLEKIHYWDPDHPEEKSLAENAGKKFADVREVKYAQKLTALLHDLSPYAESAVNIRKASEAYVAKMAAYRDEYEWMQVLVGGQSIVAVAEQSVDMAKDIEFAFHKKINDLRTAIDATKDFVYDKRKSPEENDAIFTARIGELDAKFASRQELDSKYQDFKDVLLSAGDFVDKLVDDEGFKAYALKGMKSDGYDYVITGVQLGLGGAAGLMMEIPHPGAGMGAAAIRAGIGKIADKLHVWRRDVRIEELQKKLSNANTPSDVTFRREFYMAQLDDDKTLMATRVLEIQSKNIHDAWSVIGIPLAEIPVPLVGDAIRSMGEGICTGWYKSKVGELKKSLAPDKPINGELVTENLVDKAKEVTLEMVQEGFGQLLREFADTVIALGEKAAKTFAEWLAEKVDATADILKDLGEALFVSVLTKLAALVVAKLLHWLGGNPMAQAIGSGDLRKIIQTTKDLNTALDGAVNLDSVRTVLGSATT
jgi:hypothetical protein